MRTALTTGQIEDPKVASLLLRYTLSKELNITPKEQDEMSATLVKDLLTVHGIIEEMKSTEIEKVQKNMKQVKQKMK